MVLLIGVLIAITMELAGVPSLPFAVGVYLPIQTSVHIFIGGAIRWFVDRLSKRPASESETSPGTLLATGYIAGGTIAGVVIAFFAFSSTLTNTINVSKYLGPRWNDSDWPASLAFLAMMIILAYVGFGRMKPPIAAHEQPTIER